jgi:hypothetical protein
MDAILSLTSKVQQLDAWCTFWDRLVTFFVVLTLISLTCLYFMQYKARNSSRLLGKAKDELYELKDATLKEETAKAQAEASKAQERAANLEKEAEEARAEQGRIKLKLAGRRISAEQHDVIVSLLISYPAPVVVAHASNDPEAAVYAEDIARTLRDASWTVTRSGFIGPQPTFGMELMRRKETDPDLDAEHISDAFKEAGIPISKGPAGSPFLTINVWNKPPPF